MKTFLYKSLTCLLALALAFGAPARAFAAAVSDERLVSLSDGSTAYLFKVSDVDGDLFVVVSEGSSRTVYRPVVDPLSDPDLAEYRGVVLPSGTKAAKFEVVQLKAPGAALAETRTVAEAAFGDLTLKLEAAGDAKKGYELAASAKVKDVGSFSGKGRWDPAQPSAPLTFEADNAYKAFLESTFGKTAVTPGDKIYATVTLPAEWTEALKDPSLLGTEAGRQKVSAAKGLACEVRVPFKLKLDPQRDPFAMTARIDPVGKAAKLEVDAGQTWAKPFGVLPVTFSKFEAVTDFSFASVNIKTSGDIDFVVKTPVELEAVLSKGASAKVKLVAKPTTDLVVESLKLAGIPVELTDIVTPILKKIKIGSLDLSLPDLSGALPDIGLKFSIDTPKWAKEFDLKLAKVDLSMPKAFAVSVGNIVFPELKANFDLIALGLSLEGLTGKWRLIDLDLDFGSMDLDAEGSPDKGFALTGQVTLNGVGTFNVDGSWSAANAAAPVILKVDNAAKGLFEASLGKALPPGWLKLGDKITATLALDQAWIDDLKRGKKAAGKTAEPKKVDIKVAMPLTLKLDPTKDAFKLSATVDPGAKTTTLALDPGQTWKDPFGYLPVTFSKLDVRSDLAFETFTVGAAGDMTFFKAVPLALDATIKAGKVTAFKLKATPPADFLNASLKAMKIPVDIGLPLDEVKWAFEEFLKHVKLGTLDISAPDFDAKLADLGLKFSVDMPNWKHDFDLKLPGVSLMDVDKIAVDLGNLVFPVLVANLDKFTAGLIFKGISGKWDLGTLDLDLVGAHLFAEGDAAKGYTLTGKIWVKDAGDLNLDGFWSASKPLDPIVFTADNVLKTALEKSLSQMVAKDALTLGSKITAKVGIPASWVERLKRGGRAGPKPTAGAPKEPMTLVVTMPFTAKLDPTKAAFKMTATVEPLKKALGVAFDPGQTWDKPFGIVPVRFDTLSAATDPALTWVSLSASGKLDFLVSCDASVTALTKGGAAPTLAATLKPAAGTNIVKAILNGRVPAASQTLVDALLPNTVVDELAVATDPSKKGPDIRLKFTVSKGSVSQKFDVLVKDGDLAKPDEYAAKAAPQIVDQLTGKAAGDILAKLGLKGKFTVVDLDIDVLKMKIVAEGDPKEKYTLSGDIKLPLLGGFDTAGSWYPAKPTDPVVFESRNIFKPIIDEMLSGSLSKEQFELKDKMTVTLTLPDAAVSALKGGGSAPPAKSQGGSGGSFTLDVGFPMKLQIDPTQKAFNMTGRAFPFDQTATLELDSGQVWKEPFGIIPATFNSLVLGTDPTFTSMTLDAKGKTDFLGDMEFEIAATFNKGQKPRVKLRAVPSGDIVAAILKKVKLPTGLPMPKVELTKFNLAADLNSLQQGKLPSAALKFSIDSSVTGRLDDIGVDIPSINFKQPDKFAEAVAGELTKVFEQLVTKFGPAVIDNATKKVGEAAKDPVGTTKSAVNGGVDAAKSLGGAVGDFGKDPLGGSKNLAEGAADLVKKLGETAFNAISDEVGKWTSDPLGAAQEKARAALDKAKEALDKVKDLLKDAADFAVGVAKKLWSWASGSDDEEERTARRRKREAKALEAYLPRINGAQTIADYEAIIAEFGNNSDMCKSKSGNTTAYYKATYDVVQAMRSAMAAKRGSIQEGYRAKAKAASTLEEIDRVKDAVTGNRDLCGAVVNGSQSCDSASIDLLNEVAGIRKTLEERKKEEARIAIQKVRDIACCITDAEASQLHDLIKASPALCVKTGDGGWQFVATGASELWHEMTAIQNFIASRRKISKSKDVAALDKLEADIKAMKPADGKWPTLAGHLASAPRLIEDQREVFRLYDSLQKYVKSAVTWEDFSKLQSALDGNPPPGYYDFKRLADGAPAGPMRDLVNKVGERVAQAEVNRKAVSDYLKIATALDVGHIKNWLDGKSKSLNWLYHQKETMPWSSSVELALNPADVAGLKAQSESRKNAAWLEAIDGKLRATWDEDYLNKLKGHFGGRTAADLPDVSGVSAETKESIIEQCDDQLSRLPAKRNEAVKDVRKMIAARESEKDLLAMKKYLTKNLDKNAQGPDIYYDASPLTRAQKEGFIKQVEERLKEVPKFQEAQMAAIRASIAAAVRRDTLTTLEQYLGGTRFEGMPRYDALTADQVKTMRTEIKKRDDELKKNLPKEQEAAVKAYWPKAPAKNLGELLKVLESIAQYGYPKWSFDGLPDTAELSKAQASALAKDVKTAYHHVTRQAVSNFISRQNEKEPLSALKAYVAFLAFGTKMNPKEEEAYGKLEFSELPYVSDLDKNVIRGITTEIDGRVDALAKGGSIDDFRKLIRDAKGQQALVGLMAYLKTGQADAKLGYPLMTKLTGPEKQTLMSEIQTRLDNPQGGGAPQTGAQKFEKLVADSRDPRYLGNLRAHIQSGGRAQIPGFSFPATTGLGQPDVQSLMRKIDERLASLAGPSTSGPAPALSDAQLATAIKDLYTNVLGRAADEGGLKWYKQQYPKIGVPGIARELFKSDDFRKRSRRDQISALYLTILGRAADDGGLTWYAGTPKTIRTIAEEMLAGDEFRKRPAGDQDAVKKIQLPGVLP